jgi:hypothetical protein
LLRELESTPDLPLKRGVQLFPLLVIGIADHEFGRTIVPAEVHHIGLCPIRRVRLLQIGEDAFDALGWRSVLAAISINRFPELSRDVGTSPA